jgi:hypothetical protein
MGRKGQRGKREDVRSGYSVFARLTARLTPSLDRRLDILAGREFSARLLGVFEVAVDPDLEHPTARAAKAYVSVRPYREDQLPRLTGARLVASLAAVFDLNFHFGYTFLVLRIG